MLKVSVRLKTRVNQAIWVPSAIKVFYSLTFYNYLLSTNLFCIIIEAIGNSYDFLKSVLFQKRFTQLCIISGSSGVCALLDCHLLETVYTSRNSWS